MRGYLRHWPDIAAFPDDGQSTDGSAFTDSSPRRDNALVQPSTRTDSHPIEEYSASHASTVADDTVLTDYRARANDAGLAPDRAFGICALNRVW